MDATTLTKWAYDFDEGSRPIARVAAAQAAIASNPTEERLP